MEEYSYELPEFEDFKLTLGAYVKKLGHNELNNKLKGVSGYFTKTSRFSNRYWDECYAYLNLEVPLDDLDYFNDDEIKDIILKNTDLIIPNTSGYYVESLSIAPSLIKKQKNELLKTETLFEDLDKTKPIILSKDLIEIGRDMARSYLYMYYIENSLRNYIENKSKAIHGENYFSSLNIPTDVLHNYNERKRKEGLNKWLSVRGNSEIYYLDFKDLGKIIQQNWNVFKGDFSDLNWITSKINEIAECRNLIAHNSKIDELAKNMIETNYKLILRQLGYL